MTLEYRSMPAETDPRPLMPTLIDVGRRSDTKWPCATIGGRCANLDQNCKISCYAISTIRSRLTVSMGYSREEAAGAAY
jgi:hypothetical protein